MPTPQVLIRNLNPTAVERLKSRAKSHGRSFEAELRVILHEAAGHLGTTQPQSRADIAAHIRAHFAGRTFSDSTDLIRADRDSR